MMCVKQSELDYSLRNTPLGPLQCHYYVGTGRSCQLVSYNRRLPFSFQFIYPGLLIRKMEEKLKFNFVLSESARNGHHENVNHWRVFFWFSDYFFLSLLECEASLPHAFYLLPPHPTFLSLPIYFIGGNRCYQIGENANQSLVLKVGIQMKIGWEKKCHFFLPRAIERIFLFFSWWS